MKKSTDIRTLKNLTTPTRYCIPDSRGLHLWIRKDHKKYWVYRYTFQGKRFDMSLGSFPEVTLAEAKLKHLKFKSMVLAGDNPSDEKRERLEKLKAFKTTQTFEKFALEYIERMSPKWTNKTHATQWLSTVTTYAFPFIGDYSLEDVSTNDVLEILTPIWGKKHETAIRLRGRLERIFSAAITTGIRTTANPAIWRGHLENLLPAIKREHEHFNAIHYSELPNLMGKLMTTSGVSSLALQFTILNAARSGEVLYAKRSEIEGDIWTIPANRMKSRREHKVPLCTKSLEILAAAIEIDQDSEYIFSKSGNHLSAMAMLMKVRRLKKGLTVHGFRSTFRDWVSEETNHSPEVAEMALAHTIANKVEAAYRRGKLIERRRQLMNDWEAYCLTGKSNINTSSTNHS